MIDSLNYYVKLFNIIDNTQVTINDTNLNQSPDAPYLLEEIDVSNDIFNPLANTALIKVAYYPVVNEEQIITPIISGGNIVQIFEAANSEIGTCIFVGYNAVIDFKQNREGSTLTLECSSILNQLTKQLVINSKEDVATLLGSNQPITDFFANKAVLGDILSFMTTDSVLSFVANQGIVNTPNTLVPYNGVELPFDVIDHAQTGFNIDSKVYYFASTDDDRLTSLMRTILAYQMILYQDLDGTIKITQPNVDTDNNQYSFNVGAYNSELATTSMLYTDFNYVDKSADIANRTYASLVNIGINITTENAANSITYVAKVTGNLFPRPVALLNSGIFEITKHAIVDMFGQMLTDPLLLNVLTKATSGGNLIANDVSGVTIGTTAAGIYANMLLAQELFNETQIELIMARGACTGIDPISGAANSLLPIPFGRTIQVFDQGTLRFSTDIYYVYGFNLTSSGENGTKLTLKLTKPYTMSTVWSNV